LAVRSGSEGERTDQKTERSGGFRNPASERLRACNQTGSVSGLAENEFGRFAFGKVAFDLALRGRKFSVRTLERHISGQAPANCRSDFWRNTPQPEIPSFGLHSALRLRRGDVTVAKWRMQPEVKAESNASVNGRAGTPLPAVGHWPGKRHRTTVAAGSGLPALPAVSDAVQPRAEYMKDKALQSLKLGTVSLVRVEKAIWVANMVAQRDIRWRDGVPPIRYDALLECLKQLGFHAHQLNASIHMPRIGCELAGGKWEKVEPLIRDTLPGTQIFVYDLPR